MHDVRKLNTAGPHPRKAGADAEDRAAAFLQGEGFTIVTRRFKGIHGELDLVALDGETLVFVEVKLRRGTAMAPEGTVGAKKRARMAAAARQFLAAFEGPERAVRFDVVALGPGGVRHHREAFWPDDPCGGEAW